MTTVILVNIFIWAFFLIKKEKTFLWLLVINILIRFLYLLVTDFDSSNFIPTRAHILLIWSEIFYSIFVSLYIIFFYSNRKQVKNWGIFTILFYFLFLLIVSATDKGTSFKKIIIFSHDFLLLPAAFIYFSRGQYKKNFFKMLYILNTIVIIYFIYCSLNEIGTDAYGLNVIYTGTLQILGVYIFVFSLPVFLWRLVDTKQQNSFIYAIIGIIIILSLLTVHRTYIILMAIQLIIFLFYYGKTYKYLPTMVIIFLIITSSIYFFRNDFVNMMQLRGLHPERTINEEGRYLEYILVWEQIVMGGDIKQILIGNDLFNNQGDFVKYNILNLRGDRKYHSIFSQIIFDAGVIGIILFYRFFFLFFKDFIKRRKIKNNTEVRNINFLFFAIFITLFIDTFVNQLFCFYARGFPLYILGFVMATKYNLIRNSNRHKNNKKPENIVK